MVVLFEDRVNLLEFLFSYVGVDCFGLLDVRFGRSIVKRYGVIFICLLVWVIYIEVVYSLDIDFFIGVFRWFIVRRG